VLVVIDRLQMFYPPAAAAWGIDLGRLLIVRPQNVRDELWAAVQALRSPAVAAVWAMIGRLDCRAFRRLQLAAQAGHTLGLLLRPAYARGQPSWADVRLEVGGEGGRRKAEGGGNKAAIRNLQSSPPPSPFRLPPSASRRVRVQVLRTRSGQAGSWTTLEIDDANHAVREVSSNHDAHPLPLASKLADPAAPSRSARA
jgi:hypothetical protein